MPLCTSASCVAREDRVRVVGDRRAVRRPARVRDARDAFEMRLAHLLVEIGDARDAARAPRLAVAEHGDAARIVAAIFEAPQSFDQDRIRCYVAQPRRQFHTWLHRPFQMLVFVQGARARARVMPISFLLDRPHVARLARSASCRSAPARLLSTSFQTVVPAAIVTPRATRTGATSCVSEPTNTSSSITVRNLFAPS